MAQIRKTLSATTRIVSHCTYSQRTWLLMRSDAQNFWLEYRNMPNKTQH